MSFADLIQNPSFAAFRTRDNIGEQLRLVLSRYRADVDRWTELLDLSDAIFDGVITVKETPALLAQAFGLSERDGWRMARDLIAVELAPVRDVVEGLDVQINEWRDAHPKDNSATKTYDDYAEEAVGRIHLSLSLQHVSRLAGILKKYLRDERTKEQTVEFLGRPIVIGGLGMTPEQSAVLLQFVDEDKGKITLVDTLPDAPTEQKGEQPVQDSVPAAEENLPEVAPSHELSTETPIAAKPPEAVAPVRLAARDDGKADAAEIAAHAKAMTKARIAPLATDEKLDAAVSAAVAAAATTLASTHVAKEKFADIARMAIKGVRDPHHTRAILERDLGVTGESALDLIEAVMTGIGAYNASAAGVERALPAAHADVSAGQVNDSLDKRFAAVAGTMPKETVEPVLPEARVSAARTVEEERAAQSAKVDPVKLAAAAESQKPEPARAMLTVGSVPPPQSGEVQMVTDVQFKPHLVGPVEELGTMTTADFRRLSSDAEEAGRKVRDALEALQATSYEDRIRGVQAWRQSPVSALYASMAAEALNNGVALAEVAARRRNKGEDSLTPAELTAIANVNAAIRF